MTRSKRAVAVLTFVAAVAILVTMAAMTEGWKVPSAIIAVGFALCAAACICTAAVLYTRGDGRE